MAAHPKVSNILYYGVAFREIVEIRSLIFQFQNLKLLSKTVS